MTEAMQDPAAALDELRARVVAIEALIAAANDRVDAIPQVDEEQRRRRLGQLIELLHAAEKAAIAAIELGDALIARVSGRVERGG